MMTQRFGEEWTPEYATEAAAELLTLAIGLGGDTPERRIHVAQHHFDGGDPERARTMLEALVTSPDPGRVRAEALRLSAIVRLHDDSYRKAADYLQQALDEVGADLRPRTQILIELPFVLVNLGRIPEALRLVDDTVAASKRLGDPDLMAKALATAVMIRFLSGHGLDGPAMQRALDLEDPAVTTPVMFRPTLISSLLRTGRWTGRLRFTPLIVGLYVFVIQTPVFVIAGPPPAAAAVWTIAGWGLCWALLGVALWTEAAVAVRSRRSPATV